MPSAAASTRSSGLVATQTHAFMFADLDGSAAMWRRVRDAYVGILAAPHRLLLAVLAAHGGEGAAAKCAGLAGLDMHRPSRIAAVAHGGLGC